MQTLTLTLTLFGFAGSASRIAAATQDSQNYFFLDLGAVMAATATAREPETFLLPVGEDVENQTILWNKADLLSPREPQQYGSLLLHLGSEWTHTSGFFLRGLLFTGEIRDGNTLDPGVDAWLMNGRTADEAWRSGEWVTELSVGYRGDRWTLELGRQRTDVGHGLVYDDYGTGISAHVDLHPLGLRGWSAEATCVAIGRTFDNLRYPNPLFSVRFVNRLSLFESWSAFGAVLWDRHGALVDVLMSAMAEFIMLRGDPAPGETPLYDLLFEYDDTEASSLTSNLTRGTVGYLGASIDWIPASGLSLRGSIVGSRGQVRQSFNEPSAPTTIQLLSLAGHVELHYGLTPTVDIGARIFALGGDSPPSSSDQRYNAFVGVAPLWTWTNIFFSSGLSQGYYAGRVSPAGVNGHGVVGGGPSVDWIGKNVSLSMRVAFLRALAAPPLHNGGHNYGTEIDTSARWEPLRGLELSLEADCLQTGSFFREQTLAYRLMAWAHVSFSY